MMGFAIAIVCAIGGWFLYIAIGCLIHFRGK